MTLLQRSISGGVMVLILLLLRPMTLHRLPKWSFVLMGDLILLRLLCPLALPSPWSVYSLLRRSRSVLAAVPSPIVSAMPMEQAPVIEVTHVTGGVEAVSPPLSGHQAAFFLWLAGALMLGGAFLLEYIRSYRRFALSLPAREKELLLWQQAHPLLRPYQVRISQEITSPLTYGVFRPVILLPKDMDRTELDYILTHEWNHIRRWDCLRKMVLALTLSLHWFNPLVWVLFRQMNRDMELACDEAVLNHLHGDNRRDYALALLRQEEDQLNRLPLYSGFSKNGIEERVRAVMKNRKPTVLVSLLALVLVVVLGFAFATSGTAKKPLSGKTEQTAISDFLNAVYTTDYEGRFTALQEIRDDPTADTENAMSDYMSGMAEMVTPELLERLTANRIPYKYDGLNSEEHPWKVTGVALTPDDGTGRYQFAAVVMNEDDFFVNAMTGEVTIDPDTHLISDFWEGTISTEFQREDYISLVPTEGGVRHFSSLKGKPSPVSAAQATGIDDPTLDWQFELDEEHPYFCVSAWVPVGQEHEMTYSITDEKGAVMAEGTFSDQISIHKALDDKDYVPGVYTFHLESAEVVPLNADVRVEINKSYILSTIEREKTNK